MAVNDRSRGNTGRSADRSSDRKNSGGGRSNGGGSAKDKREQKAAAARKAQQAAADMREQQRAANVRESLNQQQAAATRQGAGQVDAGMMAANAAAAEKAKLTGGKIGGVVGGGLLGPLGAAGGSLVGGLVGQGVAERQVIPGANPQSLVLGGNRGNQSMTTMGSGSAPGNRFSGGGRDTGRNIPIGTAAAAGGQLAGGNVGGGIGGIVNSQTQAQQQAIEEQRQQQALISGQLDPYRQAGTAALGQQQALLGMGGQEQQQQAFAAFGDSPGQKFLRDRQEKSLLRNQAAIGGLGGGNVRTALQEQAAGFAAQDYNNQFARLGQLSGQGLNATTQGGQFGAGTAANISNLQVGQGEARASGILAGAQKDAARTEGIANIVGLFSDEIGDVLGGAGDYIGDTVSSWWG